MAVINDYGFPFTNVDGDRLYSSETWREYFNQLISDGVVGVTDFLCEENGIPDKSINVATGSVYVKGAMRIFSTVTNLPIAENTSGNARIDRVVVRFSAENRLIELDILEGTPDAEPVAPSLTRTSAIWELSLCQIAVANGFSTITNTNITDERLNESLCGFAKTIYMQTFDDENNLLKYDREVTVTDADGNPTEVQYTRPIDDSLFLKRNYSNADANGFYQTCTEEFYMADGTTVYKTIVYTFTFFMNGVVETSSREVTI